MRNLLVITSLIALSFSVFSQSTQANDRQITEESSHEDLEDLVWEEMEFYSP